MEFYHFWEVYSYSFSHHECVTKVPADISGSGLSYFLGRERGNESTQS